MNSNENQRGLNSSAKSGSFPPLNSSQTADSNGRVSSNVISHSASTNEEVGTVQNLLPTLSLPKGGGAIRGIGEKFSSNPVTGTGSLSVPITTSPGRAGFDLNLELTYNSGAGNGPFGIGWSLSTPSITRKTDKGLPRYIDSDESDTFILSGAEDLVPVNTPTNSGDDEHDVQRYRPRIEGLFARIEQWTRKSDGDVHWRAINRDNVLNIYGLSPDARIADPRPHRKDQSKHPAVGRNARVFSWLIEETRDDRGNVVRYKYKAEDGVGIKPALSEFSRFRLDSDVNLINDGDDNPIFEVTAQRYLERIQYGNRTPISRDQTAPNKPEGWLFEVVFDYGEYDVLDNSNPHIKKAIRPESHHPSASLAIESVGEWEVRADPFSTYRPGFEVRTYRICKRVLMYHRFPDGTDGLDISPCLVRSTDFHYDEGPVFSYLESVTHAGYIWKEDSRGFERDTLPSLSLGYAKPPTEFDQTLRSINPDSLEGIPSGIDGNFHQWVDLNGEGIPGVLTAQMRSWFYKRNNGGGMLGPPQELQSLPSPAQLGAGTQLTDLGGDGQLDLVTYSPPLSGYFTRTEEGDWQPFVEFSNLPNIDWNDPNLRFIDLNGDGHPDIFITEENAFVWYPSRAKKGFDFAKTTRKSPDEINGPKIIFADGTETIFLGDMSGDGLVDIVRIRNGDVCYWPNLGYGNFGRKVTFKSSPRFDTTDQFDPRRIQFADIDGSGTNDIIYLARDGIAIYLNQSGNGFSEQKLISSFPVVDNFSSFNIVDIHGQGTPCLVWSSPLPAYRQRPLTYVDPLGGMAPGQRKPHLLTSIINNLGAETRIAYAPSTRFYLDDRKAGRQWLTRLAFPVQVVERIERVDHVNHSRLITRFAYHHGYFDGYEREFRGFACVDRWDAESFGGEKGKGLFPDIPYDIDIEDEALSLPPVRTTTWFHTGTWLEREHLERELAKEYYREDPEAPLLLDTILPKGLTSKEEREAARALKGSILRQEIYAEDGSAYSRHPYTVSERNYELRLIHRAEKNGHAIFFTHPRETVDLHYERNPLDPRMQQQIVLSVDEFGKVTKSVTIGYPRRKAQLQSEETETGIDLTEQSRLWATVTDNLFINKSQEYHWYRVGVPIGTAIWELTGLTAPEKITDVTGSLERWRALSYEDVEQAISIASHLSFEEIANSGYQLRLIESQLVSYLSDDLIPLPIGDTGSLSLKHKIYKLILTDGLIDKALNHDIDDLEIRIDPQWLRDECGYIKGQDIPFLVSLPEVIPKGIRESGWWAKSGHIVYEDPLRAQSLFYLPEVAQDPFGNDYSISYDIYTLLEIESRDPVGSMTQTENNYRLLSPWLLTDPNRNRTAVQFDALGMVVRTVVMGKEGANEGDSLEEPTSRFEYDLHRISSEGKGKAAFVKSIQRERHRDPSSPWQVSYAYFDGSGREIMRKVQAEPGPAPLLDNLGQLTRTSDSSPLMRDVDERWVGTGRVVFDNKGNIVKNYEPFYWSTPDFNDEKDLIEWGVTPLLHYDPLGRLTRTDHPNGTFVKVEFDAWSQSSWDENDTVLDSDWYAIRGSPDPSESEPRPPLGESRPEVLIEISERRAAWLAAKHAVTPTTSILDSLGRVFLSVTHNRYERTGKTTDEKYETRLELDIEGNQKSVVDPRGVLVLHQEFDVAGRVVHSSSPDAGDRWSLLDVGEKIVRAWDSRKQTFSYHYDSLERITHVWVSSNGGIESLVQRTIYGEIEGSPRESKNLLGKVYRMFDSAGVVTNVEYDFKGNLLEQTREVTSDYRSFPNWSSLADSDLTVGELSERATVSLSPKVFVSRTDYDALNRIVRELTPDGSRTRPIYNESNLVNSLELQIRTAETVENIIEKIDYNERGQRTRIEYSNGIFSEYKYDRETFRLIELKTVRGTNRLLQALSFTYDPVGNITDIRDFSLQTLFFNGEVVSAKSCFQYDALYQLIIASGREHSGQQSTHQDLIVKSIPHPKDNQALQRYQENYFYDATGNITKVVHDAGTSGWRRYYAYENDSECNPISNRLISTSIPGDLIPSEKPHCSMSRSGPYSANYEYDSHGNMIRMPHLTLMQWDYADRLIRVEKGGGCNAYYHYNVDGERIRKVVEKGEVVEERIYFGNFEVFKKYVGSRLSFERETLQTTDGHRRVCLIESKLREDGGVISSPSPRKRFQFDNYIGSSTLEIDAEGHVISYEEYYPFGGTSYHAFREKVEVSTKRYRYNGKERDDENSLYYFGARYYASWLGRWSSADPAGIIDGLNLFEYAQNNPIRYGDASGTQTTPTPLEEELGFSLTAGYSQQGSSEGENVRAPPPEDLFHSDSLQDWSRALTGAAIILGEAGLEALRDITLRGLAKFIPLLGQASILYDVIQLVRNLPNLLDALGASADHIMAAFNRLQEGNVSVEDASLLIAGAAIAAISAAATRLAPRLVRRLQRWIGSRRRSTRTGNRRTDYENHGGEFINDTQASPPVHSVYSDGTRVFVGQRPTRIQGPLPEASGAHSVIRRDTFNNRTYQAREFDSQGNPVRDIDFTNPTYPSGRPRPGHPGPPHQHRFEVNNPRIGPRSGYRRRGRETYEQ